MNAIEDYRSLEQLSEDIALNRERCHNDPRKISNIHNSRPCNQRNPRTECVLCEVVHHLLLVGVDQHHGLASRAQVVARFLRRNRRRHARRTGIGGA